jgi:hypothetical protein
MHNLDYRPTLVIEDGMPHGVAYLIGQPYQDWCRDNGDNLQEWAATCVIKIEVGE